MVIKKCRICGNDFFKEPILKYKNMPSRAQYLPDKNSIDEDKGIDLEIYQCSSCGLVQLNSEPVNYYKEVIRAAAISEEMKNFRIKQFKDLIEKYSLNGKKIIEIGCGKGEYLSIMKKFDIKTHGLEESKESVKHCVEEGLNVSQGFIERDTYKMNEAPFDAFFILNFLEHLPNPNSVLRGIYNNLTDDAIGIVEVPNFDMILKKKLFSEFMSDHLFYFTKETLKTLLNLNGFEIIECNYVWHDYIISAIVKKKEKIDISEFYEYQNKIKFEIEKYINSFSNKKVAIWGAGHQALAIISMMNLADKIRYVIDSATFKQGKYTPATHIPIVSPKTLDTDPVEAIIVMAASYSDEVARTIKEKYKDKINITILRDFGLEKFK
jgi:2-polyprenyl-3-methyl-5-hydroxy-6-metoxy-1,4-benzoquinol methylase